MAIRSSVRPLNLNCPGSIHSLREWQMELRNLRALVEVAKCGGFTAAARALNITQSTVSKAVQQLEHDCGVSLVDRLGRGIRLTEAGQIVLRRASNVLSEEENLESELDELRGLQRGKLKLGLPVLASSVLFAESVAAFRKRYPGIEVELQEHGSRRLEEHVRRGEVEIGASLQPISSDFGWRTIRDEPLMALLSIEHPLSGRASIRLSELASTPTILFEEGILLNSVILAAYRQRKMPLIDAGRSGNTDFIMAMVTAGLGVAFLPRVIIDSRDHRSLRAVVVEDLDMWWKMALIWRRDRVLSPAAQRWLEMVAPAADKDGGRPRRPAKARA
jgi:DNA-binding transcriptional LysR family regulator